MQKLKEKTPSSVPCESCYVNREHSLQGTKSKVHKRSTKRLKLSYGQLRSKHVQLEHESSISAAEAAVGENNYVDNQLQLFHKAVNTKCSGQSLCYEFDENVNLSNVTLQSLAKMKAKFQQSTGNSDTHEMDNLKYKVVCFHEDGNTSNADDTSCTDVSKFKSRVAQYNSVCCDVTSMCNMCTYTENVFPLCTLF